MSTTPHTPLAVSNAASTRNKGSDLFVRALENEGVEYIFGVPGEENLDLFWSARSFVPLDELV